MLSVRASTAARPCAAVSNVARHSRAPVVRARQLAVRAHDSQPAPLSAPKRVLQASAKMGGALALALILATGAPDAAEAAKTGGRAGGSSFNRARSAPAPQSRGVQPAPGPTVNNYYNSSPGFGGFSPFGFSPFGFSPFGFGGGAVVVGAPVGGGFLLNFFLITLALGVVGRVVSSFSGGNKKNERDDQW